MLGSAGYEAEAQAAANVSSNEPRIAIYEHVADLLALELRDSPDFRSAHKMIFCLGAALLRRFGGVIT